MKNSQSLIDFLGDHLLKEQEQKLTKRKADEKCLHSIEWRILQEKKTSWEASYTREISDTDDLS